MEYSRAFTWQRGCHLLLIIVVLQFVFTHLLPDTSFRAWTSARDKQCPADYEKHQITLDLHNEIPEALTADQCNELFPKLYYEVDRAVAYWKSRDHVLTSEDTDVSWRDGLGWPKAGGGVRVLIHDNELRIVESRDTIAHPGYRSRAIGFLSLLNDAINAATAGGEKLPTIEAGMIMEDIVDYPDPDNTQSFWTWTANNTDPQHERHWLIPNFDFYGAGNMGSYKQTRRRAVAHDSPWHRKIPQIVWRGTIWYNPFIRAGLNEVAKGKPWADVKQLDWATKDTYMTVDQMCRYAMTVHTEGGSYSGRLKFLLNCDSLPIIHKQAWRTYYHHLLISDGPQQNFVEVERDFSDLEQRVEWYLDHPEHAEKIIQNSLATFRNKYLAPAAQSCYIRRLIQGYATVSETPEIYREGSEFEHVPMRRGRGFEDYIQGLQDFLEEDNP